MTLRLDIHDTVTQLTQTHTNTETYTHETGRWIDHEDRFLPRSSHPATHATTVPALVHQLLYATPSSHGADTGRGFTSKPTAHVEAIDTLMLIDDEASRWLARLGQDEVHDDFTFVESLGAKVRINGSGSIKSIRKLNGLLAGLTPCQARERRCCHAHRLEADIRRWHTQARIVSGWDRPAYRVDKNTCPVCETRGPLRIRLADHTALCIECRETWDADTIGLLAEWIRTENGEDDLETEPEKVSA